MLFRKSIKWGLYLGLAVSLCTQILTRFGLGLTNWFIILTFILVVVFVLLASKDLRVTMSKGSSFFQTLLSTIIVIFISRLIFQAYMFIYTRYVRPEWVDEVSELWSTQMREGGSSMEATTSRIDNFQYSYEAMPMFTIELVKYAIPQIVIGLIAATIYIIVTNRKEAFKKPTH